MRSKSYEFARRVLTAVRRIPPGRVATYGDIAALAGRPRAARAVGTIMRDCTARDVPCHRVIAAAGRLGGYGGNESMKRELLRAEGVMVSGTKVRHFTTVRWPPFDGAQDGAELVEGPKAKARRTARPRTT
jgi:O-6-methylguanine DNA methyltransferase